MKVGIVSDHRGFDLKTKLINYFKNSKINIIDYGTDSNKSVDYPDYAEILCKKIANKEINLGISICGTGIGMCIACNKIKKIRCAKVSNEQEAKLAREHNNANVIAIAGGMDELSAKKIIKIFLETPFSEEPRHKNRLYKIEQLENK